MIVRKGEFLVFHGRLATTVPYNVCQKTIPNGRTGQWERPTVDCCVCTMSVEMNNRSETLPWDPMQHLECSMAILWTRYSRHTAIKVDQFICYMLKRWSLQINRAAAFPTDWRRHTRWAGRPIHTPHVDEVWKSPEQPPMTRTWP